MTALPSAGRSPVPGNVTALDVGSAGLRDLRLRRGVRTAEIAAELGVHPQTVLRWERYERFPDPQHVARLAQALAVPRALLVEELDRRRSPAPRLAGQPGRGLRLVRRGAGVSVRDLAHGLGVPESTVYNWEHGRVRVPDRHVQDLARVLRLAPPALLALLAQHAAHDGVRRRRPRSELGRVRHRAGFTLSEAARRAGLPRQRLMALESGAPFVRLEEVRVLARVYGCGVGLLLCVHRVEDPVALRPWTADPETLPRLLRALRRWHGDTQASLARAIGQAPATVRSWERGAASPRPRSRRGLERHWGLRPGELDRVVPRPCRSPC